MTYITDRTYRTYITDITDTLHFLRFQSMTRHDMTLLHILTYGSCAHGKGKRTEEKKKQSCAHLCCQRSLTLAARVHIYMTDRSEERNAGRQEMNDCMSECRNAILLLESHPMAGLIVCQWVAFGWHPRILGRSWREGMASRLQKDIHTSTHTVIQTDIHSYIRTFLQTYLHANSRSRDKLQTRPWGYGNCLQCYGNCSKTDTLRGGKPRQASTSLEMDGP